MITKLINLVLVFWSATTCDFWLIFKCVQSPEYDHRKWEVFYLVLESYKLRSEHKALGGMLISFNSKFLGYTLDFRCLQSSALQLLTTFPFCSRSPRDSLYPNIEMAYEYTCSPTGVALFSRIPRGIQKALLHGGGVTSCGTYGHQSGPQAIPPTASSADPLCWKCSRWAGLLWLFPFDTQYFFPIYRPYFEIGDNVLVSPQDLVSAHFGHSSIIYTELLFTFLNVVLLHNKTPTLFTHAIFSM